MIYLREFSFRVSIFLSYKGLVLNSGHIKATELYNFFFFFFFILLLRPARLFPSSAELQVPLRTPPERKKELDDVLAVKSVVYIYIVAGNINGCGWM